ncbi:MAG: hypothetical protein KKH83_08550, partial [Candidatus Margulisbacteria bacterium]|nr:hypothetical protein [Candidatus Margulisiibacteriota bacterium]
MEIKIPSLELKEEIGRGGQSIVFRALRNGRQYAVKVFSEDPSRNKNAEKRFLREAEALGRIKHTGTPRVMEVGQV